MDIKPLSSSGQISPYTIRLGQLLYAKNGETVIVKNISDELILVCYKGKLYKRSLPECFNRTLFMKPYNPAEHYYNYFGYDEEGFDQLGFDRNGYDREGYDKTGFDHNGFNRNGFDISGFNINGFDHEGYDKNGFDKDGFNRAGYDLEGYNREGFNAKGLDRSGQSWIDIAMLLGDGERKTIFGKLCCKTGIIRTCKDCHKEFLFTFGEYRSFAKKGFALPKRCKPCREEHKKEQEKYGDLPSIMQGNAPRKVTGRQMHFRYYGPYED